MKTTITLIPRDLPRLTTPTPTISSVPTTVSQDSQNTDSGTTTYNSGIPALSTSATSSSAVVTPTILPPSADNNPHIIHFDSRPQGTVFICVGAILGGILLCLIIALLFALKKRRAISSKYNDPDDYGTMEKHQSQAYLSSSPSLRDFSKHSSFIDINDKLDEKGENTELINDRNQTERNRNSLFVSPTIEIIKLQHDVVKRSSQIFDSTSSNASISPDLSSLNAPQRSKFYTHKKNNSGSRLKVSSRFNSSDLRNTRKPTPSMYLDELLLENH